MEVLKKHHIECDGQHWQQEYKSTLGRFPTGVCLAVLEEGDDKIAITINSFSSVSLVPPIIQFSLKNHSRFLGKVRDARQFSVYFLARPQTEEALMFAKQPASPVSPQVLGDSAAAIHCRLEDTYQKGDHTMVFGEVKAVEHGRGDALAYYRSHFTSVEGYAS
ncbi:flavin reductase family protein [Chromobacterium subtsugae]|uniref:flavin reductase family protein n=1 Tax=Chromobacterium subtsugae TaxID=251747 RepID=UPI00069A65A6|nr:flavin reductase family protein [Chromobacterium subtsugae]